MRKAIILLSLYLSMEQAFSQSATSVTNGPWLSPTTWNCGCIPVMNYAVTINHTVTLNTSMSFTTATSGITINSGGALLQDNGTRDILIAGGSFNNAGHADFRYFWTQSGGTAVNSGTINLGAFTNSVNFTNSGHIIVDSMTNTGSFTNTLAAIIKADSMTNNGIFTNNGTLSIKWTTNNSTFTNNLHIDGVAHTNNGTFTNNDSLLLDHGLWNTKTFNNQKYIKLGQGFYNNDVATHKASFNTDGLIDVMDSWYNTDTVKGGSGGHFNVIDSSANSGYMKGSFSFCDYTPITSTVDYNSGSISSQITFCAAGIEKYKQATYVLYPNPASSAIQIGNSTPGESYHVQISDITGQALLKQTLNQPALDISALPEGIYFVQVEGNKGSGIYKLVISH